jgi:hypothetical protein
VLPRLTALLAAPISMELFLELAPLRRTVTSSNGAVTKRPQSSTTST